MRPASSSAAPAPAGRPPAISAPRPSSSTSAANAVSPRSATDTASSPLALRPGSSSSATASSAARPGSSTSATSATNAKARPGSATSAATDVSAILERQLNAQQNTSQAAAVVLRPGELGPTSGWGRSKDAAGFVLARTRVGPVRYKDVTEAQTQFAGFAAPPLWTIVARNHPRAAPVPKTDAEFDKRLKAVYRELQARGAAYALPADAPESRWLRLRLLEARLAQYHEREHRLVRNEHIATVAGRTAVMKKFREERATRRLIAAVATANTADALLSLELGAPPNYLFHNGETLLTMLVHMRAADAIAAAIKSGCDPQRTNLTGWTPLMIAVGDASESMVKALLDARADPNLGRWFGVGNSLLAGAAPPAGTPVTLCVPRAAPRRAGPAVTAS